MALRPHHNDSIPADAVAAYKRILAAVIDRRPSGTRQRLATALAKNRSFVSQISNPAYPTPIPANHIAVIFEVCHFSASEKRQFMDTYGQAHPKRLAPGSEGHRLQPHTIYLPDLGDPDRNERLQALVADFVRQVATLMDNQPHREKRR